MCSFSDVYEERALKDGIKQGTEITKIDNARRLIANGKLSLEDIASCTDLPLETVKKLAEKKTA